MRLLIPHEEIVEISKKIGKQITDDYENKQPIVVCVLKGACPFHSELIKHIGLPIELDYIQVSSYSGTSSTGNVKIKKDLDTDIRGKDIILVEDIVDSGLTLSVLKKQLLERSPNSIKVAALLDKPTGRKVKFSADYVGKEIEDLFVIGFGLDLDEKYRNLKDIYVYNQD